MSKYPKRRISAREVTQLLLEDSEDDFDIPDSLDDLHAGGDGPWAPDNHNLSDSQESSSESDCDNSRDGNSDLEDLISGSNGNASDPTSSTDVLDPNNVCQPSTSTNVDPVPSTSTVPKKPIRPQNRQPLVKRNNARPQKRKTPPKKNDQPSKKNPNVWCWDDTSANHTINKLPFIGISGVRPPLLRQLGDSPTPIQVFELFTGTEFFDKLAKETNAYAEKFLNNPNTVLKPLHEGWFPTTSDEMKAYMTLAVLFGLVKKSSLQSYWSSRVTTETPFFGSFMPYRRFLLLSKFMHLVSQDDEVPDDKFKKFRWYYEYINEKFRNIYNPSEELALDESLMAFRGRLSYIQFNRAKRARFSIKFYKLCESISGYCCNFKIYQGAEIRESTDIKVSAAVVLEMTERHVDLGHTLVIDNWYSSPNLYETLLSKGFNVLGTVNTNRTNMPPEFKNKNLDRGETEAKFSHNIMALRWQDKKQVTVLSTYHDGAQMTKTKKKDRKTGKDIEKPAAILEYNKYMNGVDRQDQVLASFPIMRRYCKGYMKIFFYMFDMLIYNSFALHRKLSPTNKKHNMTYTEYKEKLCDQILEIVQMPEYKTRGRSSTKVSPLRLQGKYWGHFPQTIPLNELKANPTKRCVVCYKKKIRSESRYQCEKCQVALHLPECFKLYHTHDMYWLNRNALDEE